MVWNQAVIDPALGYDSLIAKASFVNDEPVGPSYRPQIGDVSLLRQIAEKIVRGEVWDARRHMLLQCVAYSGHFPFALPERLREVRFSDRYPERMRDYMATARYTDRAIGLFVDRLRAAGVYDNTLVVITGDHEGLGEMRRAWCESTGGRGLVADRPMVPFIVLKHRGECAWRLSAGKWTSTPPYSGYSDCDAMPGAAWAVASPTPCARPWLSIHTARSTVGPTPSPPRHSSG